MKYYLFLFCLFPALLVSHCEIPCGIYNDHLRIHLIEEHIQTVEKSMKSIKNDKVQNQQQLIRWVINKDTHAQKIQDIVSHYFLHQRIKPTDPTDPKKYQHYQKQLEILHRILVHSMKAKQTTDLKHIKKLKTLLAHFEKVYFQE